eukprot:4357663-Prorocentrum_lima.AAC.1
MRCIGKPNTDGERSQADQHGEEGLAAADSQPIEDHENCAPLVAPITTLQKLQIKMPAKAKDM